MGKKFLHAPSARKFFVCGKKIGNPYPFGLFLIHISSFIR